MQVELCPVRTCLRRWKARPLMCTLSCACDILSSTKQPAHVFSPCGSNNPGAAGFLDVRTRDNTPPCRFAPEPRGSACALADPHQTGLDIDTGRKGAFPREARHTKPQAPDGHPDIAARATSTPCPIIRHPGRRSMRPCQVRLHTSRHPLRADGPCVAHHGPNAQNEAGAGPGGGARRPPVSHPGPFAGTNKLENRPRTRHARRGLHNRAFSRGSPQVRFVLAPQDAPRGAKWGWGCGCDLQGLGPLQNVLETLKRSVSFAAVGIGIRRDLKARSRFADIPSSDRSTGPVTPPLERRGTKAQSASEGSERNRGARWTMAGSMRKFGNEI